MTEPVPRSLVIDRQTAANANLTRMELLLRSPGAWVGILLPALAAGFLTGRGGSWGAGVAWTVLTAAVVVLFLFRAGRKATKAVYPVGTEVTVMATSESLHMRVPDGQFTAPWSSFSRVDTMREHLVLRPRGTRGTIVIPPGLFGPDTVAYADAGISGRPAHLPPAGSPGSAGVAGAAGAEELDEDSGDSATSETRAPGVHETGITVELTPARVRAMSGSYARWSVTRPFNLVVNAAAVVLAILFGVLGTSPTRWLPLVLVLVVLAVVPFLAQRRTQRRLSEQPAGRLTMTFDDHSFTRTSDAGTSTTEFSAIKAISVSGDAVVVLLHTKVAQLLPVEAIPDTQLGRIRQAVAASRR